MNCGPGGRQKNARQRKGNRTRFIAIRTNYFSVRRNKQEIMIADLQLPCQRPGGWVPNYVPVITTRELDPPDGCCAWIVHRHDIHAIKWTVHSAQQALSSVAFLTEFTKLLWLPRWLGDGSFHTWRDGKMRHRHMALPSASREEPR